MKRQLHIPIEGLDKQEIQGLKSLLNDSHENANGFVEINTENIFIDSFDVSLPEGYEIPLNFPNCCQYHRLVADNAKSWFLKFPDCCEVHKNLAKKPWFRKSKYNNVPDKILKQLSYTESHICENIDSDNWYRTITDYIEYNFHSFGQPSIGQDRYYILLKYYLNVLKDRKESKLSIVKYNRIMEYLNVQTRTTVNEEKSDLNVLYSTFQKWVKTIPDLHVFSIIKEELTNKMPMDIFLHDHEYNPYLGIVRSKIRTQSELIEILISITKEVLLSVSELLLNQTFVLDINKHEISLLNESHKLNQAKLLGAFSKGEIKYVKVIKNWLRNEATYFQSVKPLIIETKAMITVNNNEVKRKILFLSANPIDLDSLRLDIEIRKIMDEIRSSSKRDNLEVIYEPAVRIKNITRAMNAHLPSIVHFSGHGSGANGLCLQNDSDEMEYFSTIGLSKLFKLYKNTVKCVVLNACYSAEQAKAISQNNIYVIGMNSSISDKAATDFSVGFYQSIAEGKSVKFAFEIGLINNSSNGIEFNAPELWKNGRLLRSSN